MYKHWHTYLLKRPDEANNDLNLHQPPFGRPFRLCRPARASIEVGANAKLSILCLARKLSAHLLVACFTCFELSLIISLLVYDLPISSWLLALAQLGCAVRRASRLGARMIVGGSFSLVCYVLL